MSSPANCITVGERVLLHLNGQREMDDISAPFAVTQDGIAEAVKVTRAHAAIELKKLIGAGLVDQEIRHIPGGRSSRKVYELTVAGRSKANSLGNYVTAFKIDVCAMNRPTVKGDRSRMIETLKNDMNVLRDKIQKMDLQLKALEGA